MTQPRDTMRLLQKENRELREENQRLADTLRDITRCVFLDDAHSAARAALDRHTKAEA